MEIKSMIAFIYLRESEEDKKKTASLPQQEFLVQEMIKEKYPNVQIIDIYREKKSAKIPDNRPLFNEMVRRIKKGEGNTILNWRANRNARNPLEGGELIQLVDEGKLQIITSDEGIFDKDNSELLWDKFRDSTKFSKDHSKEAVQSIDRKVREGIYPGHAKWGYLNYAPDLRGSRYIITDPDRWEGVKGFVLDMLTGLYTVKGALERLPKDFTNTRGRKMSESQAAVFLRDPFMTGHFTMEPERFKGKIFKASTLAPNDQKPMISMGQFLKLQKILDSRVKRKGNSKSRLTFQGIPKCEECGYTVTGEVQRKLLVNGKLQIKPYYRCTKGCRKQGKDCLQPHMPEADFNLQVESYIDDLALEPEYVPTLQRILDRKDIMENENDGLRKENRTKRLKKVAEDKKLLAFQKMEGLIEEEEYKKQKKELMDLEDSISNEEITEKSEKWDRLIDDVVNFAANVKIIYENGDDFIKQMILKIVGSNLLVGNKILKIEAKEAFIALKVLKNFELLKNEWIEPPMAYSNNQNSSSSNQTPVMWAVQGSNL